MPFTQPGAERSRPEDAQLNRRISTLVMILMFMAFSAGCGSTSSSGPTPPPPPVIVTITIDPAPTSLFLGQAQQFSATVTGTTNTLVNWSVNGILGDNPAVGIISTAGLYTAAQILPNPAGVTITATSQADATKNATLTVTIKSDVTISLLPPSANLGLAAAQFFTASMKASGNPSLAITWSVNGIAGGNAAVGTIVAASFTTSLYTAPSTLPTPSSVTITAQSVADPSAAANAAVTIQCSPNSISPMSTTLGFGKSQTFTATLCTPAATQFVWGVNGIVGGNSDGGHDRGCHFKFSAIYGSCLIAIGLHSDGVRQERRRFNYGGECGSEHSMRSQYHFAFRSGSWIRQNANLSPRRCVFRW